MVTIRSHKIPILRGFLIYLIAVIQTIIQDHIPITMRIKSDDQEWEQKVKYLVVCNGPREGGGFLVAPDAKIDDGLISYVMITDVSRLMMFRIVPEVMKGTHLRFKQVRTGTCKKLSIVADRPLYIHTDGEVFSGPGTNLHKLSFDILPGALKVVKG
jgi:diacylglycerol kinase family enzyme